MVPLVPITPGRKAKEPMTQPTTAATQAVTTPALPSAPPALTGIFAAEIARPIQRSNGWGEATPVRDFPTVRAGRLATTATEYVLLGGPAVNLHNSPATTIQRIEEVVVALLKIRSTVAADLYDSPDKATARREIECASATRFCDGLGRETGSMLAAQLRADAYRAHRAKAEGEPK